MCKCTLPNGLTIKPDGVHELAAGVFETEQVFINCTVEISRCKHCGEVEISWYRTPETEEVPPEAWDDVLIPYRKDKE